MKTALVAGATGTVGKALVYQLLEDDTYHKVVVLVRRPLTIKHPKLEVIETNFSHFDDVIVSPDVVFCCLGTTIKTAGSQDRFYKVDHDKVCELAKIMLLKGTKTFVMVSAMGASVKSAIFYNRVKGETERDIMAVGFECCVVVRPSLLLTARTEFRLGEALAQLLTKYTTFLFIGPLKKWRAIKVEQVAKAMRHYSVLYKEGSWIIENDQLFV